MQLESKKHKGLVLNVHLNHNCDYAFGCSCAGIYNMTAPSLSVVSNPKMELELSPASVVPVGERFADLRQEVLEHRNDLFDELHKQYESYALIIMSGLVNNEQGVPSKTYHHHGTWAVASFVDYLKAKGEYIIGSPILANPMHKDEKSFSLRRGWFWMPNNPSYGMRHIADTEYVANKDGKRFLPFEAWMAKYEKASGIPRFELKELLG